MFYNVLKRALQANIKNVNNFGVLRLTSSSSSANDEIKDALDIEANLFENSLLKHEPVNTREALRKHRVRENSKQKKQHPKATVSEHIKKVNAPAIAVKHAAPVIKRDPAPLIEDKELNLEFTRLTLQVDYISIDMCLK